MLLGECCSVYRCFLVFMVRCLFVLLVVCYMAFPPRSVLFVVGYSFDVCCMLVVVCRLLCVGWFRCVLFVVCSVRFVVCCVCVVRVLFCSLRVAVCYLFGMCCSLCVFRCLVFVVLCVLVVACC